MRAIIIGATGLVGNEILRQSLEDSRFSKILVFTRRSTNLKHAKLEEHIVEFKNMSSWKHLVKGDAAFSALGTTKAQAGSIEAQYEIDYTYQANFAKACAENGVGHFVLISSMSANADSRIPYTRMKGELENFVKTLGFQSLQILRPGPLEGPREKERSSEQLMIPVTRAISRLPLLKFLQPVTGSQVAKVAMQASFASSKFRVIENTEVVSGKGS